VFSFDEVFESEAFESDAPSTHADCRGVVDLYSARSIVTEENRAEMVERIDPDRKLWFIFSSIENPNYEMQERLMSIATRYHLG
jgi:hypothetical protein